MKRFALAVLLVLAVLPSCRKRPGPPSLEYAEARDKLIEIRKDRVEDAYFDPRIEEVLALLAQVDPKSVDADAARELKAEIDQARAEKARHDQEEAKLIEQVRASPSVGSTASLPAPSPAAEPEAAAGPTDAGPPKDPVNGMSASDFKRLFSDCYDFVRPAMGPTGNTGETWALKDMGVCRDRHPGSVGHYVILLDNKVSGMPTMEQAAPTKFKLVNGQLVPAGAEPPAAPPPPAPAPAVTRNDTDTTPAPDVDRAKAYKEGPAANDLDTTPRPPSGK